MARTMSGSVTNGPTPTMLITFSAMALLRPIPWTSPGDDPLPDDGCTSEGAAGSLTGHPSPHDRNRLGVPLTHQLRHRLLLSTGLCKIRNSRASLSCSYYMCSSTGKGYGMRNRRRRIIRVAPLDPLPIFEPWPTVDRNRPRKSTRCAGPSAFATWCLPRSSTSSGSTCGSALRPRWDAPRH